MPIIKSLKEGLGLYPAPALQGSGQSQRSRALLRYWVRVIFQLTVEVGEVFFLQVECVRLKKFLQRGGVTTEPFPLT